MTPLVACPDYCVVVSIVACDRFTCHHTTLLKVQEAMITKKWKLISIFLIASLCIVMQGSFFLTAYAAATASPPITPPYWPTVLSDQVTPAQYVAPGVDVSTETWVTVKGDEHASILHVNLANPFVRLGVVQANAQLLSPDETLSSMADRTEAVAGINGDFFEIGTTGDPINMEVLDGQLEQSPNNYAVFGVDYRENVVMSHETFSGSITDGSASYPLAAFNHHNIPALGGTTLVTSEMGPLPVSGDTVVILQPLDRFGARFVVEDISSTMTTLNKLPIWQEALVGGGAAAQWLQENIHPRDILNINMQITPNNNLRWALGGGPIIMQNGQFYTDPTPPNPGDTYVNNPLTGIGVSRDGRHLVMMVFDGRGSGPTQPVGLDRPQLAASLLMQGAYNAMMFDGGGSSELVAHLPGQSGVSVINYPSDGHERKVANGLFVYSL